MTGLMGPVLPRPALERKPPSGHHPPQRPPGRGGPVPAGQQHRQLLGGQALPRLPRRPVPEAPLGETLVTQPEALPVILC
jgi:hypothetical protein